MKKSQAAILGALIVFWGLWASNAYKDKSMHALQSKLEQEINDGLKTAKKLPLENMGGVTWDYVCFVAYDAAGSDVANGASVAKKALEDTQLDFTAFAVANKDYNELSKNWTHGLVFVSSAQKLLIATALGDIGSAARVEEPCASAKSAALTVTGKTDKGRTVAFSGNLK